MAREEVAGRDRYKYQPVAASEGEASSSTAEQHFEDEQGAEVEREQFEDSESVVDHLRNFKRTKRKGIWAIVMGSFALAVFLAWAIFSDFGAKAQSCDDLDSGYTCQPEISHFWGQYAPYFSVPSELPTGVPDECSITFVQVLHRHGARDPTASKTVLYSALIDQIHAGAASYSQSYAFIKDYNYSIGADQLSTFGQQELINSGIKFYERYQNLTKASTPFWRSSGEARVVESAQNFTQGFHDARLKDCEATDNATYPYGIVTISEDAGFSNTLSHSLCTVFEDSSTGDDAQATWAAIFTPAITARLNANLPGANITAKQTIYMMDLCPFDTVHDVNGTISPFCALFTENEWHQYDYYESLGKYYGIGAGNALGPTQGVGFTNELIARLTNTAVVDHTSTNHTLDDNPATFPLDVLMYADFSHDNDMTGIFFALGLYNSTSPLSNTTVETVQALEGWSAAWTVPFAARMYLEKMQCEGEAEELVRVVVNDRVLPMESCGGDRFGRCGLDAFVESLSFAREGGDWDECGI